MISFKGVHFPKDIIPYAVFFYVRYGVSYRDLEEIMEERGVKPHLTAGLSTICRSSQQKPKNGNAPLHHLGGWMKPTLKSKANGFT